MDKQKMQTMNDAHIEHGTVIKSDETALVVSPREGAYLLAPSVYGEDDQRDMTNGEIFLAACFLRSTDEAWFDEMVAWIQERRAEWTEAMQQAEEP